MRRRPCGLAARARAAVAGTAAAVETARRASARRSTTSPSRASCREAALLASLGCGNPTAVAELREGETVLDLGSGGGIDVLLSAKRVGPTGTAYGLDMTDEMLALAQRNAAEAGVRERALPEGRDRGDPAAGARASTSSSRTASSTSRPTSRRCSRRCSACCGPAAASGSATSSRRTGSSEAERAERGSYAGCIAGALSRGEYEAGLAAAGFEQVDVSFTHEVADGLHGAIVKATKPS